MCERQGVADRGYRHAHTKYPPGMQGLESAGRRPGHADYAVRSLGSSICAAANLGDVTEAPARAHWSLARLSPRQRQRANQPPARASSALGRQHTLADRPIWTGRSRWTSVTLGAGPAGFGVAAWTRATHGTNSNTTDCLADPGRPCATGNRRTAGGARDLVRAVGLRVGFNYLCRPQSPVLTAAPSLHFKWRLRAFALGWPASAVVATGLGRDLGGQNTGVSTCNVAIEGDGRKGVWTRHSTLLVNEIKMLMVAELLSWAVFRALKRSQAEQLWVSAPGGRQFSRYQLPRDAPLEALAHRHRLVAWGPGALHLATTGV